MIEKTIMKKIEKQFGKAVLQRKRRIWINVKKKDLLDLCRYLKPRFEHLSTISVTDLIKEEKYEVAYFLWSYSDKIAFIIKTKIPRKKPVIDSVAGVWEEGQVHERELHELFGVNFKGNPDLSELFLEGWKQKPPFRKDFDWRKYVRKKYYKKKGREKSYFEVSS